MTDTKLAERINMLEEKLEEARKDSDRLNWLENEMNDVRFVAGAGTEMCSPSDEVIIQIVSHHMAKPHERVEGENWHEDLRAAIDEARAGLQRRNHSKDKTTEIAEEARKISRRKTELLRQVVIDRRTEIKDEDYESKQSTSAARLALEDFMTEEMKNDTVGLTAERWDWAFKAFRAGMAFENTTNRKGGPMQDDGMQAIEEYAREMSCMVMRLTGGGSEMFRRIGDEFYADPKLCEQRIVEKNANRVRLASVKSQSEEVKNLVETLKKAVEALDFAADDLANCDEFESADFRRTQADTFRATLAAYRESPPEQPQDAIPTK